MLIAAGVAGGIGLGARPADPRDAPWTAVSSACRPALEGLHREGRARGSFTQSGFMSADLDSMQRGGRGGALGGSCATCSASWPDTVCTSRWSRNNGRGALGRRVGAAQHPRQLFVQRRRARGGGTAAPERPAWAPRRRWRSATWPPRAACSRPACASRRCDARRARRLGDGPRQRQSPSGSAVAPWTNASPLHPHRVAGDLTSPDFTTSRYVDMRYSNGFAIGWRTAASAPLTPASVPAKRSDDTDAWRIQRQDG